MSERKWMMMVMVGVLSMAAVACGEDEEEGSASYTISDQALQGQINGASWTAMSGSARVSSFDENELSIEIYGEQIDDPCGFGVEPTLPFLLTSMPKETGERELSFSLSGGDSQTVTFVTPPSDNLIITEGKIRLDAIGDDSVSGGFAGGQGDDTLNGTFEVTLCP